MSTVIELSDGQVAFLHNGTWTSDSPDLADFLNQILSHSLSAFSTHQDYVCARMAVERLGGRVIFYSTLAPPLVSDRVLISGLGGRAPD